MKSMPTGQSQAQVNQLGCQRVLLFIIPKGQNEETFTAERQIQSSFKSETAIQQVTTNQKPFQTPTSL